MQTFMSKPVFHKSFFVDTGIRISFDFFFFYVTKYIFFYFFKALKNVKAIFSWWVLEKQEQVGFGPPRP